MARGLASWLLLGLGGFALAGNPPPITRHPISQRVLAGHRTSFIGASSDIRATFQWEKNGQTIPGATSPELILHHVQPSDEADYRLIIRNSDAREGEPAIGESVTRTARVKVLMPLAGPGEVDSAWAESGLTGKGIRALALDPSGGCVIAGDFQARFGQAATGLARVDEFGQVDLDFSSKAAGQAPIVRSVVRHGDGWLVGGNFPSRVARYLANGMVDSSFTPPSPIAGVVRALSLQRVDQEDRVLVGLSREPWLMRLHANGREDQIFGREVAKAGLASPVNAIVVAGEKILLGSNGVRRLLAQGSSDDSFARLSLSQGEVLALAVDRDRRILLGGNFQVPSPFLARLKPDGARDDAFTAYTNGAVEALQATESHVVVGGDFARVNGSAMRFLALLDHTGRRDATWQPPGLDGKVSAIAITPRGEILIGGEFGQPHARIVRLKGWSQPPLSVPVLVGPVPSVRLDLALGGELNAPIRAPAGTRFTWFRDQAPVASTTTPFLAIPLVGPEHHGAWSVVANTSVGLLQSQGFPVHVRPPNEGRPSQRLLTTTPQPIPDDERSQVDVALSAPVLDLDELRVTVSIQHTDTNDLMIWLITPTGRQLRLFDPQTGDIRGGRDFTNTVFAAAAPVKIDQGAPPYYGAHAPSETSPGLASLTGKQAAGAWKLRVRDFRPGGAVGQVTLFALDLYEKPRPVDELSWRNPPVFDGPCCALESGPAIQLRHWRSPAGRSIAYEHSSNLLAWAPANPPRRIRQYPNQTEEVLILVPHQIQGCYLRAKIP